MTRHAYLSGRRLPFAAMLLTLIGSLGAGPALATALPLLQPAEQAPATPPAQDPDTPPSPAAPPTPPPAETTPPPATPPARPAPATPPDRPATPAPRQTSPAAPATEAPADAAAGAPAVAESPQAAQTPAAPAGAHPCDGWSQRPVFKLGQDHVIRSGESTRDTVVVFGSVDVDGSVCGDLVVVFGNVSLASTAYVEQTISVTGGSFTAAPGATVDGDLVVVGGTIDVPASFSPGRDQVIIGLPVIGDRVLGVVPWLTRGLLYGRLIVPDLAWNWWVVAVTLFVALLLNLLFPRATTASMTTITSRPLSTFAAGLLVLLLSGPIMALLAVSIIGAAVVPVMLCALLAAWLIGSIAVARWIGASLVGESEPDNRVLMTRSLVIGFAIKTVAYMIPVLGLSVWALSGVLGLGAATLAAIGAFRAENPRRAKPGPPPLVPPPPTGTAAAAGSAAAADTGATTASAWTASPDTDAADWSLAPESAMPEDETPNDETPGGDLRRFPRGAFVERLSALVLDVVLVGLANGLMDLTDRGGAFVLLLLAYHIVFWAWKGTTIGGLIMQLRLVRVDGRPLYFVDALVRALTGIFSLGALGVGFLWILRDEQRQSWHDIVAGTLVVRVPRGFPLP